MRVLAYLLAAGLLWALTLEGPPLTESTSPSAPAAGSTAAPPARPSLAGYR